MTDNTYNGWTNYETWNLNLWLSNDENAYRYWASIAEGVELEELTESLKTWAQSHVPETVGFHSDMLSHAISRINFEEIAKSLKEQQND